MIRAADEQPHGAGDAPHWQESWYFNWYDAAREAFGLARVGYVPGAGQAQAIVLTLRSGRAEYLYPGLLAMPEEWGHVDARRGLRAGLLDVNMEEPLRRWRIRLFGTDAMDLTFEALTDAFDFTDGERRMAENMTGAHFEQAGRVHGWTDFNGRRCAVDGYGQRDKSWGVRDWRTVEGWNWISAQFPSDPDGGFLAFNATETFLGGVRHPNGFVHRGGENFAVKSLEVRHVWGGVSHVPARTEVSVLDAGGGRLTAVASSCAQFPLYRGRCLIQETPARFVLDDGRVGHGVVEHVWRPSVLEMAVRTPGLAMSVVPVLPPLRRVFR